MSEAPEDAPHESQEAPDKLNAPDSLNGYELPVAWSAVPAADEPKLFRSYSMPEILPPVRIPNFGHLCILGILLGIALLCTGLLTRLALAHHLFGISSVKTAMIDIHYTLGSEGLLYLLTLAACLIIFPMVWHKGFFAGVQWNFATAMRLRFQLVGAAFVCFVLALLSGMLIPGPSNAPIDTIFRAPGAAWLLFGFGISFAPFFEEMFFRGFLLPAVCTAFDWFVERNTYRIALPLRENGHPQWSVPAMITGTVVTSIPFALLHAEQTGWAVGPFCLLLCVSMVLCTVRLSTRSLASSTLVHSSYNFLLFSMMLVGTSGFHNLDKM